MSAEINCALLLAAGSGARMQGSVGDKILAPLHGRPVFSHVLRAFAGSKALTIIAIVYRDSDQRERLAATLNESSIPQEVIWVQGGEERQQSVHKGLQALPSDASHTLIHDCARPLVSTTRIDQLIATVRADGAACLAHPVSDTIKRIASAGEIERTTLEDLDRDRLWAMETPQAFWHRDILQAYQYVHAHGLQVSDDCAAAACLRIQTTLIHNREPNPKITTAADLDYINWLLSSRH